MSEQVASAAELDALPPLQLMVLEVLAARYRLGEVLWTFTAHTSTVRAIRALEAAGLVTSMGGIVPRTIRASLTPSGVASATSPTYRVPDQPQRVQPSREDVARLLAHQNADWIHGYLGADPATGETHDYGPRCSNWEPYAEDADAVLALFAQQPTVAEVARKAWARGYSDAMGDYEHSDPLPPNPYGESGADRCTSDVTLRNEGHRLVRCVLPEGHVEFHTDRRGTSWTGPEREARP